MDYVKLPEFEESGYVVVDSYDQAQDPAEWLDIEFVDWKSSGETASHRSHPRTATWSATASGITSRPRRTRTGCGCRPTSPGPRA